LFPEQTTNGQLPAASYSIKALCLVQFLVQKLVRNNAGNPFLLSTEGGLGFINFFWKLMKTKILS
jgi:hypothetical protein